MIKINEEELGMSAKEVTRKLKVNRIYPREYNIYKGEFYIHSLNMDDKIADFVGKKLLDVLKS